jgi:hypothetical protein
MKLTQLEMVFLGGSIAYVAFFTHPPPQFVQYVLSTPWGHAMCLLGILVVALRVSHLAALFVGIAYILSSNPSLEYFEEKEKKKEETSEQPKSGAPEPDLKGLAGKIMAMQGKDVVKPPMPSTVPKPASPESSTKTEHYSNFQSY